MLADTIQTAVKHAAKVIVTHTVRTDIGHIWSASIYSLEDNVIGSSVCTYTPEDCFKQLMRSMSSYEETRPAQIEKLKRQLAALEAA